MPRSRFTTRLTLALAGVAMLASGCLLEAAGGGAIPLTRSGDAGLALDFRGGLGGGDRDAAGAFANHLQIRVQDNYSEVALGPDVAAALVIDHFAIQGRLGASIAPLIGRGDKLGFSPFGTMAEVSLLGCSDDCYRDNTSSPMGMFSLRLGVDHRIHFRSTDLIFGHDAFFTLMLGITWFHSPRLM